MKTFLQGGRVSLECMKSLKRNLHRIGKPEGSGCGRLDCRVGFWMGLVHSGSVYSFWLDLAILVGFAVLFGSLARQSKPLPRLPAQTGPYRASLSNRRVA